MEYPGLEINKQPVNMGTNGLLTPVSSKKRVVKTVIIVLFALASSFFSNVLLVKLIEAKGNIQFILPECTILENFPHIQYPCMSFGQIILHYAIFFAVVIAVTILLYFFFRKLSQLVKV